MDKIKSCCGSFCGCMFSGLRTKAALYSLMAICLFWATFDLVLSSMTVKLVYSYDPAVDAARFNSALSKCSASDVCGGNCAVLQTSTVPNPFEFTVYDSTGKDVLLNAFCTWPIGPNSSRFCCAICSIIMFVAVGIWVFRTPYPKYSKISKRACCPHSPGRAQSFFSSRHHLPRCRCLVVGSHGN
jgi:hypothetical protein